MPYKLRNSSHHKFKKARHKITNWPDYNKALVKRGSVTVYLPADVIKAWQPRKCKNKLQGGQFKYSDIAIETTIAVKIAMHMPYRATQGFITSVFELMGVNISVPNYTTMCRRINKIEMPELANINDEKHIHVVVDSTGLKIFGQGQWSEEKHGLKKRRKWRKFHLTIDRDSHAIIAQELTESDISDDAVVPQMLEDIEQEITHFSADTAYDTNEIYDAITSKHGNNVTIAIPPRPNAALSANYNKSPTKRDHNILFVEEYGKYRWQDYSDYNYRALAETGMFRYQALISEQLFSRRFTAQKVEARIACRVLNRLTALGMPRSVKIKRAA